MSDDRVQSRRKFLGALFAGACALPLARIRAEETGAVYTGIDYSAPPQPELPPAAAAPPAARKLSVNSAQLTTRHLALTFDDGPHPKLTPELLDMLAEREMKATFYVIGRNVQAFPDVAQRIVAEGHEIANHTWSHPSLSKLSSERVASELGRAHEQILETTGVEAANMRPPYGAVNDRVRKLARERYDYTTIMWSVDPMDWRYRDAGRVSRSLLEGAAPGAILLCHDIHPSTIAAMPATLDGLLAKGYQLATVSDLLSLEASAHAAPVGDAPPAQAGA